ncbi:hypothetical protein LXA43DRAFT_1097727 [Ganoderma leucocontextum]|nr:hypothetical protein LXA43DRAFT_1097727 [Ganoderma leucocontextum]
MAGGRVSSLGEMVCAQSGKEAEGYLRNTVAREQHHRVVWLCVPPLSLRFDPTWSRIAVFGSPLWNNGSVVAQSTARTRETSRLTNATLADIALPSTPTELSMTGTWIGAAQELDRASLTTTSVRPQHSRTHKSMPDIIYPPAAGSPRLDAFPGYRGPTIASSPSDCWRASVTDERLRGGFPPAFAFCRVINRPSSRVRGGTRGGAEVSTPNRPEQGCRHEVPCEVAGKFG